MNTNSVLHITPNSLYIANNGKSVLFMGFSIENIEAFQYIFEKHLYNSELQFFYDIEKKEDEETLAWKYLISSEVDFIVTNIDGCSPEELIISLASERDLSEAIDVIFVSVSGQKNISTIIQKYTGKLVKSLEEFEEVIKFLLEEE